MLNATHATNRIAFFYAHGRSVCYPCVIAGLWVVTTYSYSHSRAEVSLSTQDEIEQAQARFAANPYPWTSTETTALRAG